MSELGTSPNGLVTRNAETAMGGVARTAEGRGRAEMLAGEINVIKAQVRSTALLASVEIGRRLQEAKELVPAGEWTAWLENNVDYSTRTAQNLMALAREYDAGQAKALEGLDYTKAVLLLSVPREEREQFAESHDVEGMSARELQREITSLKQEKQEMQVTMDQLLQQARDSPVPEMQQQITDLQNKLGESRQAVQQAKAVNKEKEAQVQALRAQLAEKDGQLQAEKEAAQRERQQLQQALNTAAQPLIQQVTPPDVEQELEALRAKLNRSQEEQALRAGYDLLRHSLSRLKEQLSALAARDRPLADKFRAAFAKGLRLMGDELEKEQTQ